MNRILHTGIVLVVAVHMLCGCCLHHAHASAPPINSQVAVDIACPSDHLGDQHEHQSSDHGSKQRSCNDGTCVFTRPDPTGSSDLMASLACLAPIACESASPTLNGIDAATLVPSRLGASIPRHLLNQALLL